MILRAWALVRSRLSAFARNVHAPRWVSQSLLALIILCALGLGWLVLDASVDKETGLLGRALLFGIGLVAGAAFLFTSWEPGETPPFKRLTSRWGIGFLVTLVLTAFGAMTNALAWFEPRNATTRDTDRIEAAVAQGNAQNAQILAILRQRFPDDPPILSGITGRWGEQSPACGLVWDIRIIRRGQSAALVAELVRRPDGVEPFRLLADIVSAQGNRMTVIGEEPEQARGAAAEFALNAATGRLVWDDKSNAGGVEEYQRCPA